MCFFFTAYRPVKDAAAELTVMMYGLLTAKKGKAELKNVPDMNCRKPKWPLDFLEQNS